MPPIHGLVWQLQRVPNLGATAAAIALCILLVVLLMCALCWAVQVLDMLRVRRKEEDRYFGRLLKEHQHRGAEAATHMPASWITPTPATTPRDAESLAEYWVTKDEAAEEALSLPFDVEQIEVLLNNGTPQVAQLRRGPEEQAILDKMSKAEWVAAVARERAELEPTAPITRQQAQAAREGASQDGTLLRA